MRKYYKIYIKLADICKINVSLNFKLVVRGKKLITMSRNGGPAN